MDDASRITPVTGQKLDALAKRYDWLWDQLLGDLHGGTEKPRLRVFEGSTTSGYRSKHGELHVVLGGHDLDEIPLLADVADTPDQPALSGWPSWERELHHEFVHLYEDRVVAGCVTDEGRALDSDPTVRRFDGPGHDATYYTPAAEVAHALGFEVRMFVNAL